MAKNNNKKKITADRFVLALSYKESEVINQISGCAGLYLLL